MYNSVNSSNAVLEHSRITPAAGVLSENERNALFLKNKFSDSLFNLRQDQLRSQSKAFYSELRSTNSFIEIYDLQVSHSAIARKSIHPPVAAKTASNFFPPANSTEKVVSRATTTSSNKSKIAAISFTIDEHEKAVRRRKSKSDSLNRSVTLGQKFKEAQRHHSELEPNLMITRPSEDKPNYSIQRSLSIDPYHTTDGDQNVTTNFLDRISETFMIGIPGSSKLPRGSSPILLPNNTTENTVNMNQSPTSFASTNALSPNAYSPNTTVNVLSKHKREKKQEKNLRKTDMNFYSDPNVISSVNASTASLRPMDERLRAVEIARKRREHREAVRKNFILKNAPYELETMKMNELDKHDELIRKLQTVTNKYKQNSAYNLPVWKKPRKPYSGIYTKFRSREYLRQISFERCLKNSQLHTASAKGSFFVLEKLLQKTEVPSEDFVNNDIDMEDISTYHFDSNSGILTNSGSPETPGIGTTNAFSNVPPSPTHSSTGSDINIINSIGDTPLHVACAKGVVTSVEMLLSNGARVSMSNFYGNTPLHCAVIFDSIAVVKTLTAFLPISKDFIGNVVLCGKSIPWLIQYAEDVMNFYNGDVEHSLKNIEERVPHNLILTEFQETIPDFNPSPFKVHIDKRNTDSHSALHVACSTGNFPITLHLILKGASPTHPDQYGNCSLHIAVICGHLHIVKFLLEFAKVRVSIKNKLGETAVHLAAACGRRSILALLVEEFRGDPLALTNKPRLETPCQFAFRHHQLVGFEWLLSHGGWQSSSRDQIDAIERSLNPGLSTASSDTSFVVNFEHLREVYSLGMLERRRRRRLRKEAAAKNLLKASGMVVGGSNRLSALMR